MNLIDRDALKDSFASMECIDHNKKATTIAFGKGVRWVLEEIIPQEIDTAPVIDATPVVHGETVNVIRCKECVHWHTHKLPIGGKHGCSICADYRKPDDFCSYGERKE